MKDTDINQLLQRSTLDFLKLPSAKKGKAIQISQHFHRFQRLVSREDNLKPVTDRVAQWCSKQTGLALKASMGASGTCDDRLHFTFHEEERWSIADSLWWE